MTLLIGAAFPIFLLLFGWGLLSDATLSPASMFGLGAIWAAFSMEWAIRIHRRFSQ